MLIYHQPKMGQLPYGPIRVIYPCVGFPRVPSRYVICRGSIPELPDSAEGLLMGLASSCFCQRPDATAEHAVSGCSGCLVPGSCPIVHSLSFTSTRSPLLTNTHFALSPIPIRLSPSLPLFSTKSLFPETRHKYILTL